MNQNATSIPTVSFWMSLMSGARQSWKDASHRNSFGPCGVVCASAPGQKDSIADAATAARTTHWLTRRCAMNRSSSFDTHVTRAVCVGRAVELTSGTCVFWRVFAVFPVPYDSQRAREYQIAEKQMTPRHPASQ